ncbi:MAG: DNA alkylation repair protein [Bacteroidales bacterium]|jgi:3-methyladenine DNA glycosylase AlkD|nr:DNA alkylation repair protein [Bacteroidales bacterium]
MTTAKQIRDELKCIGEQNGAAQCAVLQHFFKTGKGQYGEGDLFYGVKVPQIRALCKRSDKEISLKEILLLLKDKYHDCRMFALLWLVENMKWAVKHGDVAAMEKIVTVYRAHFDFVNNWDLVDLTAPDIEGAYLWNTFGGIKGIAGQACNDGTERVRNGAPGAGAVKVLKQYAASNHLWTQRIAIISTYYFIKNGVIEPTFIIAEKLLYHPHDLIRKAVGWMLREAGKRVSHEREVEWLLCKNRYKTMPRTSLRYAIEHFDEDLRLMFLKDTFVRNG